MHLLDELLFSEAIPNYLHPFTALSILDRFEDVQKRVLRLKAAGIRSMNLLWSGGDDTGGYTPFNSDAYWTRIQWVADICRREGMTFMMQDAAPFPTGLADGWLMRPEYLDRNKLYLGERHLDVKGPNPDGAFLVSELAGSIRSTDQEHGFGRARPFPGDRLYAVVAMRRERGAFDGDTLVDLTDAVEDGLLLWPVPEGIWRIYVLFETMNDGGRRYTINLLDAESVELNIQAIYEPHVRHLGAEIGKTWLGFFYDESEIGNLWRYNVPTLPGARRNMEGESMALPWSRALRQAWESALGKNARRLLPLLWDTDADSYRAVRTRFMDLVSRILQETYNGRMQAWCRAHGLMYIGHNCEDENTHCTLANGPAHFFRMQKHQDAAGVDLIGGQLMPGKDFTQCWYGSPEGDGEFYHYGLAKLASSAAHITPDKRGRCFCEVFAVYGDIAGARLRRFVYDHLLVNGINEFIPAPPFIPGVPVKYSRGENTYVNRMCHLMHRARPVIRVAVLYHAGAEWYGGDFDRFQRVGRILARHQISYDVIPADVFEDTDFYQTSAGGSLTVNGNAYDALIVPRAEAVPAALARWMISGATRTAILFCERRPSRIAESGAAFPFDGGSVVPMEALAGTLEAIVDRDIRLSDSLPDLRYAHFTDAGGDYYLLFNEGGRVSFDVALRGSGRLYGIDVMDGAARRLPCASGAGFVRTRLTLAGQESLLLYAGSWRDDVEPLPRLKYEPVNAPWRVWLENGTPLRMERLENINGRRFAPRYTGRVVYEAELELSEGARELDLGDVYEIVEVFLNGIPVGSRQSPPYRCDLSGAAKAGKNLLRVEVLTGCARDLTRGDSAAFGRSMSATVYNALPPGGLLGPVTLGYEMNREDERL